MNGVIPTTIEWTILTVCGVLAVGFAVGFLSGLLGVGGGFLMTPLLRFVFAVEWTVAIGSGLCQMIGTAAAGARRHLRYGNVDWKPALFMIVFTTAGGWTGDILLGYLDNARLRIGSHTLSAVNVVIPILFGAMLLAMAVSIVREARQALGLGEDDVEPRGRLDGVRIGPYLALASAPERKLSMPVLALAGFAAGIFIGLLGIGGGIILLPLMIYVIGLPTRVAVGTGLLMVFGSALLVTARKAWLVTVDPVLVALLLVSSPFGVQIGAALCRRTSSQRIRLVFGIAVLVAFAVVTLELLHTIGALSI